jgi:hypothetical protein
MTKLVWFEFVWHSFGITGWVDEAEYKRLKFTLFPDAALTEEFLLDKTVAEKLDKVFSVPFENSPWHRIEDLIGKDQL